ncbi:hypothetical protein [Burkholderia ubonensis]|uniref:hypothetical protein n=1 Tax=Burkholderia ubonensis TaxID=101571 RepID=UPI00075850B2|nr:hypothetical protein [Burkholderia ubonensis]KVD26079.1 hypothetical protein WI82_16590 [Burkholderia ubonensis]
MGAGAGAAGSTAGAIGSALTTGATATATVVNSAGAAVGTALGSTPSVSVTLHSGGGSANNPLAPVSSLLTTLTGALPR